ncbi:GNAT family N-acetyltransferase [Pseudooceanicola algae]|uniref:GNAT family N-acetyltransferase n=1 Tax=Pseudooceanicola algae TaxID=1537215 RepID=UPI0018AD2243|nr:GNAT family N-acetyltransferase [Pseudooceanicola algae]
MTQPIRLLEEPSDEDRLAILTPLVENINEVGPPSNLKTFAFIIEGSDHKPVGGLWGRTAYNWAVIELLFVPQTLRGTGLGKALVTAAEELASKRDCEGIWLDSFSFQAPKFYLDMGYETFGELPNNPLGQSRFFFRKLLKPKVTKFARQRLGPE